MGILLVFNGVSLPLTQNNVQSQVLTIFWQSPRQNQICTELDNGLILIKDETTGEAIGLEILSYRPGDTRFDTVSVHIGQPNPLLTP